MEAEKVLTAKLIFFDLDGTLVDGYEYIYVHLREYFGIDQQNTRSLLSKYLAKEITYEQWVQNDIHLLQEAGATKKKILKAIGLLKPMKGAIDTVRELRRRGYKIIVVSGGIDTVVDAVFPDHEELFDKVFINHYFFTEDGLLSHAIPTKYDMEHKATCINDMAAKYKVTSKECVFVGDNSNDVQAALTAGTSIAFNATSDELVQASTHHVKSSNLRDILPLVP